MPETQSQLLQEILTTTRESVAQGEANKHTLTGVALEMARMGERVEQLRKEVSAIGELKDRMTRVESRLDARDNQGLAYRWLIGIVLASFVGLLAIAVAHLGWHP